MLYPHVARCYLFTYNILYVKNIRHYFFRVALGLIWLKMCRLIETPDHKDTIDDIAGYAETIHMIHAERKRKK